MKPIPGFPDYCITKDGRIWSKPKYHHKGKWLKSTSDGRGYLQVCLLKNRAKYCRKVHRLILETFVSPCPEEMECRHLNGIKTDNRLENLKWGTRSENAFDSIRHGSFCGIKNIGENHPNSKLTWKIVKAIRELFKRNCPVTKRRVAEYFDVNERTIHAILRGETWQKA